MKSIILGNQSSLLNQYILEIRDRNIQKDSMRFRRNLERIGEIFAYEISKQLDYKQVEVSTPLGISQTQVIDDSVVLATILRAGLPLHQGLLNYFDFSENSFISAYRRYHKDGNFNVQIEYLSSPQIDDKVVILSDPMLASGLSMLLAYKALQKRGLAKHIHFVSIIASKEGVEYLQKNINESNTTLWIGAVDDELTAKAYIVPGLGDAGDLAFGTKV